MFIDLEELAQRIRFLNNTHLSRRSKVLYDVPIARYSYLCPRYHYWLYKQDLMNSSYEIRPAGAGLYPTTSVWEETTNRGTRIVLVLLTLENKVIKRC